MKLKTFKLSDLTPAEYNPRTITAKAMKGLSKSLEKFGYLQPLVINVHGGGKTVISGHQRVKALLAQGKNEAECVTVDFEPATEKAANIALNSETISGDWDLDGLETILEELKFEFPEFEEMNFDELNVQLDSETEDIDYQDIDDQMEEMGDIEGKPITILVPAKHVDAVKNWLADGGGKTQAALGEGAMRLCGLL